MKQEDNTERASGRGERWPNRRIFVVAAVVTLIILAIFYLPWALSSVFTTIRDTVILLILAVTMAYVLLPLLDLLMKIEWPSKKSTRRQVYAIVSIVLFIAVLAGLITLIVMPLTQQLGVAVEEVSNWVSEDFGTTVDQAIESIIDAVPEEYQPEVRDRIASFKESFGEGRVGDLIRRWGGAIIQAHLQLLQTIFTSGAYIIGLVVVPIFAYYFLTDADTLRKGVARHLPSNTREQFNDTVQDIDCMLRSYVKALLVVSVLTGIATGVVLLLTGVPVYLPLGVLAAVGSLIPVVGSIVAIIIIVAISLLTVGLTRALIVLLVYGGIQIGTDRILAPKLMAEGVGLHPVAVIIALMVGGQFFGVVGVFVAVPVTGAIRLTYIRIREYLADDANREEIEEQAGPKEGDEDE